MKTPIACTLQPSQAKSQVGEWQEMLSKVVNSGERVSPNRLELGLRADADIGSVISLAQREVACCAFFSFAIEIQADRLVLSVEVPHDAIEILDQIASRTARWSPPASGPPTTRPVGGQATSRPVKY